MCGPVEGSYTSATPQTRHIIRSIEELAVSPVLDILKRERKRGGSKIPLAELSETIALAPSTVAQVVKPRERTSPFSAYRTSA